MTKTFKAKVILSTLIALLCLCIGMAVSVSGVEATLTASDSYGDNATSSEQEEVHAGIISFGEGKAQAGKTATVGIYIEENPGIAVASITLNYDNTALTLVNVENGEIFPTLDKGLNLLWSADENCEEDGLLATLTFKVNENASLKDYIISAVVNEACNENFDMVMPSVTAGKITVYTIVYGDANDDGSISSADVLVLRKYMANYDYSTGTSTVAVGPGADANGDGYVTAADVLLMRKYMANYDFDTGTSTIVLGPKDTDPPVTTTPVTTETPVTQVPVSTVIPYKADISIELKDADGDGVYTADEVFAAANTYAFVEKGAGVSKNISSDADKVNKIETTVSYAWDGEYIYGYVVAKDPTLLAVGEDVADDPYKNWSYDGFELWYKLGESSASTKQFWASLNGYALNAQDSVKSAHFDKIEWDCAVNRETNTSYLTFKILAKTEEGVALEGGDCFYTAIQMDDRRSAQSEVYYCATYNQSKGHFGEYVLAEGSAPPVTTGPADWTNPIK